MNSAIYPLKVKTHRRNALIYLAVIASFYTIYFAKTLLLPIVLAAFISLCLHPIIKTAAKWRIRREISAFFIIVTLVIGISGLFTLLMQPAQEWAKELPRVLTEMDESLGEVTEPLDEISAQASEASGMGSEGAQVSPNIKGRMLMAVSETVAAVTPVVLTQILATILLIYFFLVYGNRFLNKMLNIAPQKELRKINLLMISNIQQKLSRYILSITLINLGLGAIVAIAFSLIGVEDAVLWGAVAALLNFAPYIGPLVASVLFTLIAYIQFDQFSYALIVSGTYLMLNLIESQFVTPTVLGTTLNLNPLIVFIWLLLWGWMWGGLGMLVGLPLLVCLSIYFDHSELLGSLGAMLRN